MNIAEHLLVPVRRWAAEAQEKEFLAQDAGTMVGTLQWKRLSPPPEVWVIKRSIVAEFGLEAAALEPMFKDFCAYTPEGCAVQRHIDLDVGDKKHVRFNVMVTKSESGGVPFQNSVEIIVKNGDVWRCDAGATYHWLTTVVGSRPSTILSYGFLL